MEEITANIVQYAFDKPTDGSIDVTIETSQNTITLQIIDQGKPFNPLEAAPPDLKAGVNERRIGGLGLFLVQQIVDDIDYSRKKGRNHLTLVKCI